MDFTHADAPHMLAPFQHKGKSCTGTPHRFQFYKRAEKWLHTSQCSDWESWLLTVLILPLEYRLRTSNTVSQCQASFVSGQSQSADYLCRF